MKVMNEGHWISLKVNISFLKSIEVQSVSKRGICRNAAKRSARFLQSPKPAQKTAGFSSLDCALQIEIAGRDCVDKSVRAAPYWFTQTARDFFNWACCFLSSRATVPRETLAGCGKSEAGLSPWAEE